jgi:hypothetical protein
MWNTMFGQPCAKHLLVYYVIMVVSPANLSGLTLEPRVDQLVTTTVVLADSTIMTQLCCLTGK